MALEVGAAGGGSIDSAWAGTETFLSGLTEGEGVYPTLIGMMNDGKVSIELKKRYMLRAIDEAWVNIIEDTIPSLDTIIRTPNKFIEEREEVLPIELSKNISVRSLQHLSQHTNYISKIEGDKIIPSKILNVFKEETLQTYENRFINTLIYRLYVFVMKRYEIARKMGQDEKISSLDVGSEFVHDGSKVKISLKVEVSDRTEEDEKVERNYTFTSDLWRRIEKIHRIVTNYYYSDFVSNMGQSYIRPPVMATNAILKNKDMRQCLALWQFIEGYDEAGYSMLIQENLEQPSDEYIKQIYSSIALQYFVFRQNTENGLSEENTLASTMSSEPLSPQIVSEFEKDPMDEFSVKEKKAPEDEDVIRVAKGELTHEDVLMIQSVDVAMAAVDAMKEQGIEDEFPPARIPEPEPTPPAVEYDDSMVSADETDEDDSDEPSGAKVERAPGERVKLSKRERSKMRTERRRKRKGKGKKGS